MAKHRSKVRFDRRIFAERPRNQLPPKEESSDEQLRTFSQLLLLAPFVILLLLGCGQLALSTTPRIPFAESPPNLIAEYGQWGFLQVRSVRKEIIAEIRRDFEGIADVGETFAQPIAKLDFAWLEEPSSPIVVAALPTIIPFEPTIVPSPVHNQLGSILPPPDPNPTKVGESDPTKSPPLTILPAASNPNSPTDTPAPTPSPTPTSAGAQSTDTPLPTSTNLADPTATPKSVPTSIPTTAPTSTPTTVPTSTSPPPTPTSTSAPTIAPTATSTPGGGGPGGWWNSCYSYRKQVTVMTAGSGVNEGYSARILLNHSSLVSAGKSRSDGNDVRVVWHSGSNWYELDRMVSHESSWNRSNSEIFFKLADGLPAYSSDGNYYIYYGCSSPGSPPDNPVDVYWYSNRFNTDNPLSGWTQRDVEDVGDWRVISGHLEHESTGRQTAQLPYINHKLVLTGRPVIQNLLVKFEFLMRDNDLISVGLCSNDNSPTGFYVGYSMDRWFDDDGVSDRTGYWAGTSNHGYSETNLNEDVVYRVTLGWTSNRILNSFNGRNFQWNAGPSSANYFCFATNSMDVALDDLFIREYVDPEPGAQMGIEETQ